MRRRASARLGDVGRMTATDAPPPPESPQPPRTLRSWLREKTRGDFAWRALVFLIAIGLMLAITTRWNHWVGRARWQVTDDAYLQSDLKAISAKVAGYVRDVPVQDFERVRAGQLVAQL